MNIITYILGSLYVMRSIFRFSDNFTSYIFNNNIINLPITKYEKINESIFSTIHALIVTISSTISITNSLFDYNVIFNYNLNFAEKDNNMQYLTSSICFSYFLIDLFKCIYEKKYLFILHHIAALNLLILNFYSFYYNENKGFYAMYLIFLLESNTILLNIGFLLKEFKFHYSITCTVWIIHLILFILFRIVAIPRVLFIYYYNEPLTIINLVKIPFFVLILSGSIYWTYRQSIGINKYLKENSVI
jgi:hypothetical protein